MATFSDIISPMQTVLVSCRGNAKLVGKSVSKDNLITVDWHTMVNINPFLYCISIGKTRFSYGLIKESGVFCVNFMPLSKEKEVLYCGRNSGNFTDKFAKTGLHKIECEKIDCCRVQEAVAVLECEVIETIDFADHTLFIGKVVHSGLKDKNAKRLFHLKNDDFTTTK